MNCTILPYEVILARFHKIRARLLDRSPNELLKLNKYKIYFCTAYN